MTYYAYIHFSIVFLALGIFFAVITIVIFIKANILETIEYFTHVKHGAHVIKKDDNTALMTEETETIVETYGISIIEEIVLIGEKYY